VQVCVCVCKGGAGVVVCVQGIHEKNTEEYSTIPKPV